MLREEDAWFESFLLFSFVGLALVAESVVLDLVVAAEVSPFVLDGVDREDEVAFFVRDRARDDISSRYFCSRFCCSSSCKLFRRFRSQQTIKRIATIIGRNHSLSVSSENNFAAPPPLPLLLPPLAGCGLPPVDDVDTTDWIGTRK